MTTTSQYVKRHGMCNPPGRRKDFDCEHDFHDSPAWLAEGEKRYNEYGEDLGYPHADYLNGVYLDHLRQVVIEDCKDVRDQEIFECHLYNLDLDTLEKLVEGCRKKGTIEMSIEPYSHHYPGVTICVRFREKEEGKR